MASIVYITIFIILFLAINNTLKNIPFFQDINPVVMSVCITILCLIGMHQELKTAKESGFDFILLPYAALGLAILLTLLLMWLLGLSRGNKDDCGKDKHGHVKEHSDNERLKR